VVRALIVERFFVGGSPSTEQHWPMIYYICPGVRTASGQEHRKWSSANGVREVVGSSWALAFGARHEQPCKSRPGEPEDFRIPSNTVERRHFDVDGIVAPSFMLSAVFRFLVPKHLGTAHSVCGRSS
jgi:hypothetical protein